MKPANSISAQFKTSFLLIDGFSMISFASAIDPLRIANKLLGQNYFDYSCVSQDGNAVTSSSGLEIQVDQSLSNLDSADLLIVTSSDGVENQKGIQEIGNCLRRLERYGAQLGAICTGSYLLAECNLLRGRACTIHWEYLEIAKETFPNANFQPQIFVQDRGLSTAAGGIAPVDLMTTLIAREAGEKLANEVRDIAIHHSKRQGSEPQRLEVQSRFNLHDQNLIKCLELMDANIETPVTSSEICQQVGLSPRQIQRLFKRYIGQSPNHYYNTLRLDHAKYLVQHTTMSVREITLATGFQNPTHFTRTYRQRFGTTPSGHRKQMTEAVKANNFPH